MGTENMGSEKIGAAKADGAGSPGIKVVGKIDLAQFDRFKKEPRFEDYLPLLKEELSKLAAEGNRNLSGFLDEDGRISLSGKDAASDQELVAAQEEAFSRETGKSLPDWRSSQEKNPAVMAEMALTAMLHKFLQEDFIVARASRYDDYNNGVDQVLIYKKTGEIVCGFDEVIGNVGDDGGLKKAAKINHLISHGGARIKYGAKMDDNRLVRAEARDIPAFFVSLSKAELRELLESLKMNRAFPGMAEEKIFAKLLDSLAAQAAGQDLGKELRIKTESALARLRACSDQPGKAAA